MPSHCQFSFFHNLPSGGALRALYDQIKILRERGYSISLYTFETSELELFDFSKITDHFVIQPLAWKGVNSWTEYDKASRELAAKMNQSETGVFMIHKCRFFGSPPILRYLKNFRLFYSAEPLRIREYEGLADSETFQWNRFWDSTHALTLLQKMEKIMRLKNHLKVREEDRKALQSADLLMTNSFFTARWLKRVYGRDAVVNYQGVDTEFFKPSCDGEREHRVLSVGRLDSTKGHDFLLRVLSRLPKTKRPSLDIVCDSVEHNGLAKIREEAARLDISFQIHFRISDQELRTLYQKARFVLCASIHEPFGLVPLEAMACATPVIAVREGGYTETVLDHQTGLLLERNEDIWARALEKYLEEAEICLRWGMAGRQCVLDQWTWEPFVTRLEGILKERNLFKQNLPFEIPAYEA